MSESLRQSLSLIALVTVGMVTIPVAAVVHAIDRHHHRPPRDLTRLAAAPLDCWRRTMSEHSIRQIAGRVDGEDIYCACGTVVHNPPHDEFMSAYTRHVETQVREQVAREYGIGDLTSRPLYDAQVRIVDLEGTVRHLRSENRELEARIARVGDVS